MTEINKKHATLIKYGIYQTRESFLKGKDQYSWPPCANKFRSGAFKNENMVFLFYKATYVNKEVSRT